MTPLPITLQFGDYGSAKPGSEPFFYDISGIAQRDRTLWLVSDEGAYLDELTLQADGSYGDHRRIPISDLLALPQENRELDLESLSVAEDALWLVGSHALVRGKPRGGIRDPEEAIDRLASTDRRLARELLARLPLAATEEGCWTPERRAEETNGHAEEGGGALVKIGRRGSQLLKQLRKDPHLGRFVTIPAKENGFDAEGLAVEGERIFVGLRGPVLRGWAVILELSAKTPLDGQIGLRRLGSEGERYLKHFLDLDGLGVRDLTLLGEDLYILAGPSMAHDGPLRIYRWPAALVSARPTLVERGKLERVLDLPVAEGADRAEGLAVIRYDGKSGFAVVHDSPAADRRDPVAGRLTMDFYPFPGQSES